MLLARARAAAGLGAAALGVAAALLLHYRAPDPSADVARGSEDAFARGLHPRELIPKHGPLRWTRERAWVHFRLLPRGPATLEVVARDHRAPMTVTVDGIPVGVLKGREVRFALPDNGGRSRDVELTTPPFRSGERELGAQLRRVTVRSGPRGAPPPLLVLLFVATALTAFGAASLARARAVPALLLSAAVTADLCLALWPSGMVRSPYTAIAAVLLLGACAVAAAVTRWAARRWPAVGPVAYAGLLLAFVVQGLAATSPLTVASDAVFHANNLERVAAGNLWLTSLTQHAPPFRFPYGVSFYLLLAPLYASGLDAVWLVRAGAAVAALVASVALLLLLAPRGDARAGVAVAAMQVLPVTFGLYSYGNLSNVFGQAMTTLFFCWWAGGGPGGWALGALLLAAGALGHFSSFVVLAALAAALLVVGRRDLPTQRWRLAAVGVGLGLSLLYYGQFTTLVLAQLSRLREGSGSPGAAAAAGPLMDLVGQWGLPILLLALAGRPRRRSTTLDRDLVGYWAAGLSLALVAMATPLDVRYLHALGLPLAVAAAEGGAALWSKGLAGRVVAAGLGLAQTFLAGRNMVEAMLWRYRP